MQTRRITSGIKMEKPGMLTGKQIRRVSFSPCTRSLVAGITGLRILAGLILLRTALIINKNQILDQKLPTAAGTI